MAASKKTVGKTAAKKKTSTPDSMPKAGKDPAGGLTAKGREYFAKKEGAHLRPGVQGPADTPEKMVRKGSFLRRHFANPRGPMKDEKGEPTRLALSAHAWGEPVPETAGDAKKLAADGYELLEQYHAAKAAGTAKGAKAKGVPRTPGKPAKTAGKKAAGKTVTGAKRPATKRTA